MAKQQFRPQFFNLGFLFIIRLVARNYYHNYSLPIINFILPVLIGFVIYEILPVDLMFPGLILHPILTVGMVALPNSLASWNASAIMKRLKVSNISLSQILFGFFVFYFLIALASTLWTLLFFIAYSEIKTTATVKMLTFLANLQWLEFISGAFLTAVTCLAIGLLIAVITRSYQSAMLIGLSLYLTQSFFIGIFLGLDLIVRVPVLLNISYASPLFYPARITQVAWLTNHPTDTFYEFANWKLTIEGRLDNAMISFSDSYWVHAGISLGMITLISSATWLTFKYYKKR